MALWRKSFFNVGTDYVPDARVQEGLQVQAGQRAQQALAMQQRQAQQAQRMAQQQLARQAQQQAFMQELERDRFAQAQQAQQFGQGLSMEELGIRRQRAGTERESQRGRLGLDTRRFEAGLARDLTPEQARMGHALTLEGLGAKTRGLVAGAAPERLAMGDELARHEVQRGRLGIRGQRLQLESMPSAEVAQRLIQLGVTGAENEATRDSIRTRYFPQLSRIELQEALNRVASQGQDIERGRVDLGQRRRDAEASRLEQEGLQRYLDSLSPEQRRAADASRYGLFPAQLQQQEVKAGEQTLRQNVEGRRAEIAARIQALSGEDGPLERAITAGGEDLKEFAGEVDAMFRGTVTEEEVTEIQEMLDARAREMAEDFLWFGDMRPGALSNHMMRLKKQTRQAAARARARMRGQ